MILVNKTNRIITLGIIPLIVIFFILILSIINLIAGQNELRKQEIEGIIDSIKYSPRNYPTIFVESNEYYLRDYYNDNTSFRVGDSIVKNYGQHTIRIYRFENDTLVTYLFW